MSKAIRELVDDIKGLPLNLGRKKLFEVLNKRLLSSKEWGVLLESGNHNLITIMKIELSLIICRKALVPVPEKLYLLIEEGKQQGEECRKALEELKDDYQDVLSGGFSVGYVN